MEWCVLLSPCLTLITIIIIDQLLTVCDTQGEILTNHEAEVILKDAAPEVVFVRCAYFMENWAAAVETVKEGSFFFSTLTPLETNALPMVS